MTVFDHYARYYDLLYRDKDYADEARYVARHIREYAGNAARLLELGCGTGGHAVILAADGYTLTGVDLSPVMLERARGRLRALPPESRQRLQFERGDVRDVRLQESFDAAISLFHVVSYQTTNEDLIRTFATASVHLPPGGLFLFDFWYGPAVLAQRPERRVKELEDEATRVTRIAEPDLRENENVVTVKYRIRVEDKIHGRSERIEEEHVMRYLFLPEIDALLERADMRLVCAKAWGTDDAPSSKTWSGFAVAQKTSL